MRTSYPGNTAAAVGSNSRRPGSTRSPLYRTKASATLRSLRARFSYSEQRPTAIGWRCRCKAAGRDFSWRNPPVVLSSPPGENHNVRGYCASAVQMKRCSRAGAEQAFSRVARLITATGLSCPKRSKIIATLRVSSGHRLTLL